MNNLIELIVQNRDSLASRVVAYAKLHHYVAFMPTLPGLWLEAIDELTEAFQVILTDRGTIPELDCHDNFSGDAASMLGAKIAKKHRHRGISLDMFLGLMKYFSRAFRDLILDSQMEKDEKRRACQMTELFFDRVEMGFCLEWTGEQKDELVHNMQEVNRELAYKKNKYLAVFQSIPTPVILFNEEHRVENMNYSAIDLLLPGGVSFFASGDDKEAHMGIEHLMPWLVDEFFHFISGYDTQAVVDKEVLLEEGSRRHLNIKFHRLVDIIDFKGTVVILSDMTEGKQIEETLRYMSFHDGLTGLFNRAYFEQEMKRLENGRFDPLGIISFDVDGLKLVNDVLGHQAGDLLLVTAASVIHKCFRENDVVARTGGDEFAVLLPNSHTEAVEQAAGRMREAVENHNQKNPRLPLSLSQGWAVREDASTSLSRIYQQADYRMYMEKAWNREVFHQRFNELYREHGNDLYTPDLNRIA